MPDGTVPCQWKVSEDPVSTTGPFPTSSKTPRHVSKHHWQLHNSRKKQILKEFPQVRQLYGVEWRTQFYAYACIILQFSLAWLSRSSYPRAIFFGLTFGPYVNAAVLCFMHEATHMLVFKNPAYNRLLSIATNVAMVAPISEIFRQHHNKHHNELGNNEFDVDVPTTLEIDWVGNSPLRKALWLMFNMIILPIRSMTRLPVRVDRYLILNWVVCGGFGFSTLAYSRSSAVFLILSLLNAQGLHPANTRQVQRHIYNGEEEMRTKTERPTTYSYYGWGNALTLNVGYHVEHHDFNRIPWTKLPELRRIAGDKWYPDEHAYHGRGLPELLNFVFNRNISLADFAQ